MIARFRLGNKKIENIYWQSNEKMRYRISVIKNETLEHLSYDCVPDTINTRLIYSYRIMSIKQWKWEEANTITLNNTWLANLLNKEIVLKL